MWPAPLLLAVTLAPLVAGTFPDVPASTTPGTAAPTGGTVLYFNDAHDIRPVADDARERGGVARLATVLSGAGDDTVVAFGGDVAGGTLFGGVYRGAPLVEAFNEIGVDVANFGQHDFDFGVETTRSLVGASSFPWISSNLIDAAGDPFSGKRWWITEVGGVRIAFVGFTDAMDTTGASADVDQIPVVEAALDTIAALTAEEDPGVVIALTQQGIEENLALLAEVPEIDVVLTEETAEDSSVLTTAPDGRWVLAPEGNLGSVIAVDIGPDLALSPRVLEVDDSVTPDPALLEIEQHYAADLDARLGEVVTSVAAPLLLTDDVHRQAESALGNLVADAFRAPSSFVDGEGADIGWIQGGGLRAEVPGPHFTIESAYSVLPFANRVVKVRATGEQIRDGLEQGVAAVEELGGGFPQVSGLSYEFDAGLPVGERVLSVTVDGVEIDPEATFVVAMTNYVHGGGDDVTAFADAELLVDPGTAMLDAEALLAFVRTLDGVDYAVEGRITPA